MADFKNVKLFTAALIAASCLLSTGSMATGAEKTETPEKVTYKFRVLKDKISALSVRNNEKYDQTKASPDIKPAAVLTGATAETAIIKTVDGVTVIGNDPAKAADGGAYLKNDDGRPKVWVDDRVRFEQNSYKTGGGNFNKSALINRMRLNLKMNLSKKATANFSANKTSDFGDKTQNRSDEPVTRGNVVIDLDK